MGITNELVGVFMDYLKKQSNHIKIVKFYLIAFIFSWVIWCVGIFSDIKNPYLIISIGGLGPVVALLVYYVNFYQKDKRLDYIKRLLKYKQIPIYIWLFTLFFPFIIILVSILLDKGLHFSLRIDETFIQKGWIYPIFLVVFGPIPEEMAWRGIAFHELIKKGYIKTQLIVALLWAIWHLPLFFIENSYQANLGIFTFGFWMFFINVISISFLTGWIYVKSNKSILLVIIFHYLINLTGEMFDLLRNEQMIQMILMLFISILVLSFPSRNKGDKNVYKRS